MQAQDQIKLSLKPGKVYSHKDLIEELRREKPGLSNNSCQWIISDLLKQKKLLKKGYNRYSLYYKTATAEYRPIYSDNAQRLIKILDREYPHVSFTVFETVLMNEFLNHLVAQNTVFIQAEKESSIFLFRFLQEQGSDDLMYKPSGKDLSVLVEGLHRRFRSRIRSARYRRCASQHLSGKAAC